MAENKWLIAPRHSDDTFTQILAVRGISEESRSDFLESPFPDPETILSKSSLDKGVLGRSLELIRLAINKKKPIVIYGDYDVDGLCATAILWETIYFTLGYREIYPYIPGRFSEGYGLSKESIKKIKNEMLGGKEGLLITVDCGITAVEEIEYAKGLGLKVVVVDHHVPSRTLPEAEAIVYTQDLAGAGIAWLLSRRLAVSEPLSHLELVALATIADMQPLLGVSRLLVKHGLEQLNHTKREGLKALIKVANVGEREITPYIVGWWLAPRLNAMGRLEHALDSLRLLCTRDSQRAVELAKKLNRVNLERQRLTDLSVEMAREMVDRQKLIQILHHEEWHEGIIGLVAGKIKEEFYRPTIAIARGEKYSKGSARSILNFNIIEALRECEECLVDVGGHPMAAGFTIETPMIEVLREKLFEIAEKYLTEEDLIPVIKIDAEAEFSDFSWDLMRNLRKLEPHGIGNPRPVFVTRGLNVLDARVVGADGSHLRLFLGDGTSSYPAIGFGLGKFLDGLKEGDKIDLVYGLSENEYAGQKEIRLEIKDLDIV